MSDPSVEKSTETNGNTKPPAKNIEKSFQLFEDGDRMVHFSKIDTPEDHHHGNDQGPTTCSLPPDFYDFSIKESNGNDDNDDNADAGEENHKSSKSDIVTSYTTYEQENDQAFSVLPWAQNGNGNNQSGKVIRFCMYIFFSFYLLFALLIFFTANLDRTEEEHLISTIAELSVDEFIIRRTFLLNASFLTGVAILGLLAFYHHRYRLFIGFALSLLVTIIFTSVTLSMALSTYNQMARLSQDHAYFNSAFQDKLKVYNWTDLDNPDSRFINRFQNEFNCCGGIGGYHDWEPLKPANLPIGAFPISCCTIQFDLAMNLLWCGYDHVEKVPGCAVAFGVHALRLTRVYKTLNMLLGEALILQLLTVVVFSTLIWKFGKALNR